MQVKINYSLALTEISKVQRDTGREILAAGGEEVEQAKLRQAAKDFEASYIAQMLTFSGLAKALTAGDGQGADAFASFYVEKIAQSVAEKGGFGLAEGIYQHLLEAYHVGKGEDNARSIKL